MRSSLSPPTGFMSEEWNRFPVQGVGPIDGMHCEDEEERRILSHMAQQAQNYLLSFLWCTEIREAYFGGAYAGVVGVFFFRILPASPEIDEWLWVIVGDLPPAYLVIDVSRTPSQALESYILELWKWVHFAKRGHSPEEVVAVDLAPTWKNAEEVETKLKILREVIVPEFQASEAALAASPRLVVPIS